MPAPAPTPTCKRFCFSRVAYRLPPRRSDLVLAGYTGWGGLSIERVADRFRADGSRAPRR